MSLISQVPVRPLRDGGREDEAESDHGLPGGAEGALREVPERAGEYPTVISVPHISLTYLSYLSGLAVSPELGSYQLTIIANCRGMIIWAIVKRY